MMSTGLSTTVVAGSMIPFTASGWSGVRQASSALRRATPLQASSLELQALKAYRVAPGATPRC